MTVLISVAEVNDRLEAGRRTVLLDVRWVLGDPHGREHYLDGHIPGAVFVDLAAELAGRGEPRDGRHPLPSEADFQETVRRWGIREGDTIVAYDDSGAAAAARAWWLLGYSGIQDVHLLDGGLAAWCAANLPLAQGEEHAEQGDAVVHFGGKDMVDTDGAANWPGILLDARAGERYRGEAEPIDPRAGHIPGAVSAPTTGNLAPDGRFLPKDELRARFAALGVGAGGEVAVYCGSGVTAAHQIAALEIAGITAALYPGSWSAWSNRPERPVATGAGDDRVEP